MTSFPGPQTILALPVHGSAAPGVVEALAVIMRGRDTDTAHSFW